MFTVTYSCRVEISQNLPDNTPIRSLEELTAEFKRMLENELFADMVVKVSYPIVRKTATPFD